MAILLYCIAKGDAPATGPLTGVAGDSVVREQLANLAVFTSTNDDKSNWLRASLQTSALEFHHVLREVFKSTAIIPFRFPTVFERKEDLTRRFQERAADYLALLHKFRELAQMEIRITNPDLKQPGDSGTQYLKRRQASNAAVDKMAAELRVTLSEQAQDWRQRTSRDGTRAFVLIHRHQVDDFRNIIRHTPVPRELSVRVSGPWPVSEFIEQS